jgi:cell division protein ZapA (FtsZ GTPase activity inhibitor)
MTPLHDSLLSFADELEKYKTPEWNTFPDIDLYMDQVITWLERQMNIFTPQDNEKLITPAMINNYVKNQVIPRPVQKKYTREHLAHLITVLGLKQVLPLSDIAKAISQASSGKPIEALFEQFTAIQDEALRHTSARVKEALNELSESLSETDAEKSLSMLALKLSLEANSYSLAAKTILDEVKTQKEKSADAKDKGKDKEKENKAKKAEPKA